MRIKWISIKCLAHFLTPFSISFSFLYFPLPCLSVLRSESFLQLGFLSSYVLACYLTVQWVFIFDDNTVSRHFVYFSHLPGQFWVSCSFIVFSIRFVIYLSHLSKLILYFIFNNSGICCFWIWFCIYYLYCPLFMMFNYLPVLIYYKLMLFGTLSTWILWALVLEWFSRDDFGFFLPDVWGQEHLKQWKMDLGCRNPCR